MQRSAEGFVAPPFGSAKLIQLFTLHFGGPKSRQKAGREKLPPALNLIRGRAKKVQTTAYRQRTLEYEIIDHGVILSSPCRRRTLHQVPDNTADFPFISVIKMGQQTLQYFPGQATEIFAEFPHTIAIPLKGESIFYDMLRQSAIVCHKRLLWCFRLKHRASIPF